MASSLETRLKTKLETLKKEIENKQAEYNEAEAMWTKYTENKTTLDYFLNLEKDIKSKKPKATTTRKSSGSGAPRGRKPKIQNQG